MLLKKTFIYDLAVSGLPPFFFLRRWTLFSESLNNWPRNSKCSKCLIIPSRNLNCCEGYSIANARVCMSNVCVSKQRLSKIEIKPSYQELSWNFFITEWQTLLFLSQFVKYLLKYCIFVGFRPCWDTKQTFYRNEKLKGFPKCNVDADNILKIWGFFGRKTTIAKLYIFQPHVMYTNSSYLRSFNKI